MINPRIETLTDTKLIGKKLTMSFANDRTIELWQSFSPRRKEITNSVNSYLYSAAIYPTTSFFEQFNPNAEYEKWAAVEVSDYDSIPNEMEILTIPAGEYAVFHYKGKPSDAQETFQYIYGEWLPNSEYELDARPYFALMGDKYKGENPDSEEEFWVAVRGRKS